MINHPRRRSATAGFTLIELLVSTLILSVLMIGYMSLFHYAIKSWMFAMNRMERSANVGGAIDVMMPDFRTMLPPYNHNAAVGMQGWNQGDALGFTQTGNSDDLIQFHGAIWSSGEADGTSSSGYDLVKMSYFLKTDDGTHFYITRGYAGGNINTLVPPIGTGITAPEDFAYRVTAFNIEYMTDAGAWQNTWATSSTTGQPKLIRVTMNIASSAPATDVFTQVSLIKPRASARKITQ